MMPNQTPEEPTVRAATIADGEGLAAIYNYYVTETTVTFEEQTVSPSEMARRIEEVGSASLPWLVAELGGHVVGYAYARKWQGRSAYRFSTEITVYVGVAHARRGIGSRLYGQLFPILLEQGIHVVISGITLPNPPSVAFHEKFGLEKVAHLREVGFKFGRWIDVGYWQRTLQAVGSAVSGDGQVPSPRPVA